MSKYAHCQGIKAMALQLQPMLEVDEPFTAAEISEQYAESPIDQPSRIQSLIDKMQVKELITKQGRTDEPTRRNDVYQWVFCEGAREWLREAIANKNTLPRGCRAHVPDMRDSPEGRGKCKVCETEHSKQIFKEAL